jgi:hypothetical protein
MQTHDASRLERFSLEKADPHCHIFDSLNSTSKSKFDSGENQGEIEFW